MRTWEEWTIKVCYGIFGVCCCLLVANFSLVRWGHNAYEGNVCWYSLSTEKQYSKVFLGHSAYMVMFGLLVISHLTSTALVLRVLNRPIPVTTSDPFLVGWRKLNFMGCLISLISNIILVLCPVVIFLWFYDPADPSKHRRILVDLGVIMIFMAVDLIAMPFSMSLALGDIVTFDVMGRSRSVSNSSNSDTGMETSLLPEGSVHNIQQEPGDQPEASDRPGVGLTADV